MLAVDLIDEIWLTVCPLILGGTAAPHQKKGGILSYAGSAFGTLLSVQAIAQEVFFCTIVGDWN